MTKTVSAVVSVFNEEKFLAGVLKVLLKSDIDEIVCVDDGSTDKSLEILQSFGDKIKLVSFNQNRGKSYAMVAGVKKATSDIILFCDGDLIKVKQSHFLGIIQPLKLGLADQALAIRETDVGLFKKLTGERAYFRKDLLPYLERLETTKFGAETYLNHIFKNKRSYWYFEQGLDQGGKGKQNFIHKIFCADKYLKAGYEILSEIIKQKKPSQTKKVQKFINLLNKEVVPQSFKDLTEKIRNGKW